MDILLQTGEKITGVEMEEIVAWGETRFTVFRGTRMHMYEVHNKWEILDALNNFMIQKYRMLAKNAENSVVCSNVCTNIAESYFSEAAYLKGKDRVDREKTLLDRYVKKALPESFTQGCSAEDLLVKYDAYIGKEIRKPIFIQTVKIPGEFVGCYYDDQDRLRPITSPSTSYQYISPLTKAAMLSACAIRTDCWVVA